MLWGILPNLAQIKARIWSVLSRHIRSRTVRQSWYNPALRAKPCHQRHDLREGGEIKGFRVFHKKWLKSRPEPDFDCLICATFAQLRYVSVSIAEEERSPATSAATCSPHTPPQSRYSPLPSYSGDENTVFLAHKKSPLPRIIGVVESTGVSRS